MPPITIISDIHGNLPALRATLSNAPDGEIWFLGDALGYYPYWREVLSELHQLEAVGRLTLV